MGDLYTELGKLRRQVTELQPLAAVSEKMRTAKEKAESEAKEWSRAAHEAIDEKRSALKNLEEEKRLKNELKKTFENNLRELEAMRKKVERMEIDAKFDKQAREGQVKRARVVQFELEETREENSKLTVQATELEQKVEDLTRGVNHERALRLQELHRNMAMNGRKKIAEGAEKELQLKAALVSDELAENMQTNRVLQAQLRTFQRQATAHEEEMQMARTDLELERKQSQRLRHELSGMEETLSAAVGKTRGLESEVSRLRRTLVLQASNQTDRSRAFYQDSHETKLADSFLESAADPFMETGEATDRRQRSSHRRTAKFSQHHMKRETRRLQTAPHLQPSAKGEGLVSLKHRRKAGRATAMLPAETHAEGTGFTQNMSPDAEVPTKSHRPATTSTLTCPGSIFVGHGLGMKKSSDAHSRSRGTAKQILKNILDQSGAAR